jgi:hypothetical protein
MARDEHNKAAEHHENAAKSHRAAAEHHGKGDHAKGKEHSTKCSPTQRTSAYQESATKMSMRPDLRRASTSLAAKPALPLQGFAQFANELSNIV